MKLVDALKSLTVAVSVLMGILLFSALADRAGAQGPPTNPAILRELQALREQVNALRPRTFYLTVDAFDAAQAPTACEPGFHMASLWEILDPTGLRYDTQRGLNQADSGSGPPSDREGWVRTGHTAAAGTGGPGENNCDAHTSNSPGHEGTIVALSEDWEHVALDIATWKSSSAACNLQQRVWCVLD